jgi:hypothetical protein
VRRAKKINSVTGTRWFTNSGTHHMYTISVYPLASEGDALMAVNEGPSLRSNASLKAIEERVVDDVVLPTSPATRAWEQTFRLTTGEPVGARFVVGCAGSVRFSIVGRGCEHEPEAPPWTEITGIGAAIIARITQQVDGAAG